MNYLDSHSKFKRPFSFELNSCGLCSVFVAEEVQFSHGGTFHSEVVGIALKL